MNRWRDPNLIIYWGSLTVLLLILLLAPRGCSQAEIKGSVDINGITNISVHFDRSLLQGFEKKIEAELAKQGYQRQDYLFLVVYSTTAKIDLVYASGLASEPLLITISMPGTVVSSNASRIENNMAVWSLAPGKEYELKLVTRRIRWWLIVLVVVCTVLAVYARFGLKSRSPRSSQVVSG